MEYESESPEVKAKSGCLGNRDHTIAVMQTLERFEGD
jgi:hypothetical protein